MKAVNVGMIGYGKIGKVHAIVNQTLPIILEAEDFTVRLAKIYSRSKKIVPYGSIQMVDSSIDIMKDDNIDLVDICTPNFTHYKLALQAIAHNKSIYLEKPLALNYEDAKNIAHKAEAANIIHQTGFMYRFMPGLIGMKELIEDHVIGEVINFNIKALHSSYLDKKRPIAWNLQREKSGGGPILDLGIHLFDAIRFVMGEVKEVATTGATIISSRPKELGSDEDVDVDVEDLGTIQVQLVDSGFGTVEVSRVASLLEEETFFEIRGTKGSLRFDVKDPWIIKHHDQYTDKTNIITYRPKSKFGKHVCNYYPKKNLSMGWLINAQFACLLNCYYNIISNQIVFSETPDFHEAAKAQKIIEACYVSLDNNSMVSVIS